MSDTAASAPASGLTGKQRLWLCAILLVSLFLGFWRIGDKGLWWDESLSLHRAQHDIVYILRGHIDFGTAETIDQHPPLYFLLLSAVTRIFGESDLALRAPSALFATLCVWLVYILGTELANRRTGLVAATLGACSPLYLWYAQEARMYTMLTCLALISSIALVRACRTKDLRWVIAWIAATAAGLLTQYMYVFVIPAQITAAALLPGAGDISLGKRLTSKRNVFFAAILALIVLLSLVLIWTQASSAEVLTSVGRTYVLPHVILVDALQSSLYGLSLAPAPMLALTIVAGIVVLAGLISVFLADDRSQGLGQGVFLLLWTVTPAVGIWLYSLLYGPVYMGSRYVIMCSPALYLLLAMGILAFEKRLWFAGWLVLAMCLTGMGISIYSYHYAQGFAAKEDHKTAASYVMAHERPGDCIILDAPENLDAFAHYYQGQLPIVPLPSDPMTGSPNSEHLALDLEQLITLSQYSRFWLVEGRTMYSDPERLVQAWLDEELLFLGETLYPSSGSTITVRSYAPPPEGESYTENMHIVNLWDSRLALVNQSVRYQTSDGTTIQSDIPLSADTSPAIGAGEPLVVSWQLAALAELKDYRVSLRLMDKRRIIWAQADQTPYLYLPTSTWPLNTVMNVEVDIRVPDNTPPGSYDLVAIVYDEVNGEPLCSEDAKVPCALDLGSIRVEANPSACSSVPKTATQPIPSVRFDSLELAGWTIAWLEGDTQNLISADLYWHAVGETNANQTVVLELVNAENEVVHSITTSLTGQPTFPLQDDQSVLGKLQFEVPAEISPIDVSLRISVYKKTDSPSTLFRGWLPWPRDYVILTSW